ncbi:MAG TPA: hypothetical protein P5181_11025 [Dermatophilaceae bacterium]|nr:hypothetical protein [Dermatophilaceae bacterium]
MRQTPSVLRDTLRLAIDDPVLRGLLLVEVGWMCAMTVFETLMPLRLAELLVVGGLLSVLGAIGYAAALRVDTGTGDVA